MLDLLLCHFFNTVVVEFKALIVNISIADIVPAFRISKVTDDAFKTIPFTTVPLELPHRKLKMVVELDPDSIVGSVLKSFQNKDQIWWQYFIGG